MDDHPQSLNPSSRAASQTPSRGPAADSSNHVLQILANISDLAGSVNLLREELAETRNTFSTMQPVHAVSGSHMRLSRHSPYKAIPSPRHKNQSRTDMMKIFREAFKIKLDIQQDTDITTATQGGQHMASPTEVDNFDCGSIPAPSLDPFRPYWDDIRCLWNGCLADQFIDKLQGDGYDFHGMERKDLKEYFFQRLETLKKELRRQAPRSNETSEQARQRVAIQHQITRARTRVQNRQKTVSLDFLPTWLYLWSIKQLAET
ncbi:hypothetical protein C0993_008287 [Termitomyces sp. T159_Od127]|nr:hypothetical protein C0993_008287 [Termitomyces sp. T159_Od127]